MTDCEYSGLCRLECPPDNLDCPTFEYWCEHLDELDGMIDRQAYRGRLVKKLMRGEISGIVQRHEPMAVKK